MIKINSNLQDTNEKQKAKYFTFTLIADLRGENNYPNGRQFRLRQFSIDRAA